jgi:hypothetical protein
MGIFLTTITLHAQCDQPNATIRLQSQTQVNSFKTTYGCTVIEGTLEIWGPDINNLDSLHLVREVGNLFIRQNVILTDLKGLSSLERINNSLYVGWNEALTSMNGLDNLEYIGDALSFERNLVLTTLHGLDNLRYIGGQFWMTHSDALLSLNGLNLVDTIGGRIYIDENAMLQNLNGLENVKHADELRVEQNPSMVSLDGLSSLSSLPNGMIIYINAGLTDVGNFSSLEHAGKRIWVSICPQVQSLDGFATVKTIYGGDPVSFQDGLFITDTQVRNLTGFASLESIQGRMYIGFNPQLETFDGLEKLQTVVGHMGIEDNTVLSSIEAIDDLVFSGGELELTDNPILSLCAVPSVCRYLDAPTGLVLIWGNGFGCKTAEEIQSNCSPITAFNLIDANLAIDDDPETNGDIRDLDPIELDSLKLERAAVATDGESTVLIKLAVGPTGSIEIEDDSDFSFEFPWGDSTYLIDGKNYIFILYTAPDSFDTNASTFLYGNEVEAYNVNVPFIYYTGEDIRENHFTITHVRPPVVLMHGTYSNPDDAWKTSATNGSNMVDILTSEGFKVFTVNYKESNGTIVSGDDISGFQQNAKVLWGDVYPQNTGGIKDALQYYRHTLGIAATQADVVGHSLGGILPRVYASSAYNPDYKRAENFMQGDINRLITIGSTHFGSHLGEMQLFLNGISPFDIGALDWLAVQGVNLVSSWVGGASPSHAVMDQLPPSMGVALPLIGRTTIPSHAITMTAPKGFLKDSVYDPDESYYDLYWYLTTLFYQVKDVRSLYLDSKLNLIGEGLQAETTIDGGLPAQLYALYNNTMLYKSMLEDAIERAGIAASILDGDFEIPSNQEIFKYALGETSMSDYVDPLYDIFVAGADPVGVAADYFIDIDLPSPQSILLDQLKVREETIEGLRSLIFNHDENDGVVRRQSQSGELEKECPSCVSHFNPVLHGYAPRYQAIQERVAELLKGNMQEFAPNGFPPPDHAQLLYYPPESLDLFKVPTTGGEAICQSGIVPSHARAMAHVADEQNTIFIMRPVNPDGTDLISQHAATKGMDIKPKSSNWGPQKGFLPVQQRYSKIWKVYEGEKRDEVIHKYDSLAQKNITDGIATGRPLTVQACNGAFNVAIDLAKMTGPGDAKAEDEVVLIPVADPTKVCYWGEEFSADEIINECEDLGPQHQLVPLLVMASLEELEEDGLTPRFLTADYDMLMTGFYFGPGIGDPQPPVIPFRPKVGQITAEQEILVDELNEAVASTGYKGGKVIHHGPENQFSHSPYIDYPLTVFAPDNIPNGLFNNATDGLILSIEMGPPGFRDIHLKQFVNRMRQLGYDLYQNDAAPGWKWTWDSSAKGFELEDHEDLADYVEQLPKNTCNKFGGEADAPCPGHANPVDASNDSPGPAVQHGRGAVLPQFQISPNPVTDQFVAFVSNVTAGQPFHWVITDTYGNIHNKGISASGSTRRSFYVDVSALPPGLFSLVTDVYGEVGRFIKM